MKRQKDRTLEDELPRSAGAQYAMGDQWRNNPRKNEEMELEQTQHPAVDGLAAEVNSDAVRAILHRNLECKVHETRKTGSGQTGDGKSKHQRFRNQ